MTCKLSTTAGALLVTLGSVTGCGGPTTGATQGALPQAGVEASGLLSTVRDAPTTAPGDPIATAGMAPLAGQRATCGGTRAKTFDLEVIETEVDLGGGTTFQAWTYGGGIPGPTIEVCEGDTVRINVINQGTTSHGLDTHALKIDARLYGPTSPGTTLTIKQVVDTPGVFMYHCASGPVTDLHIKSGLHGAMIVYPRDRQLRPARELVIVESAVYGQPDQDGHIPGTDPDLTQTNSPTRMLFNGRLEHQPLAVKAGELVRVYFVHVGPGVSSAHVIGTMLDQVFDGQEPIHGVQTWAVPAGSGAIFEFVVPAPGLFHFVDHDRLAYLPFGFVVSLDASAEE